MIIVSRCIRCSPFPPRRESDSGTNRASHFPGCQGNVRMPVGAFLPEKKPFLRNVYFLDRFEHGQTPETLGHQDWKDGPKDPCAPNALLIQWRKDEQGMGSGRELR